MRHVLDYCVLSGLEVKHLKLSLFKYILNTGTHTFFLKLSSILFIFLSLQYICKRIGLAICNISTDKYFWFSKQVPYHNPESIYGCFQLIMCLGS